MLLEARNVLDLMQDTIKWIIIEEYKIMIYQYCDE